MILLLASLLVLGVTKATVYGPPSSQYYHQDGHGGYNYGYKADYSSKDESRSHDGTTKGSYSYIDGAGHLQTAHYIADHHGGFRVHASNLPVAPEPKGHAGGYAAGYAHQAPYHGPYAPLKHDGTVDDTPEVKHAKAVHFAALAGHHYPTHYEEGHHSAPYHGPYAPLKHDGTVDDLPEVKAARYAHLAEYAKALHRHRRGAEATYNHKYYEPAPLNHDGTVADTPAIKHAKAVHFAAVHHAQSLAAASPHYEEPEYHHPAPVHHAPAYKPKYFEPAPLNHDGTVADTPAIKHAKAVHFALYHKALYRHKRGVPFQPAPLNPDGTVAETPEIKQLKAIHLATHAAEYAAADHSWVEPQHYDEPLVNHVHYQPPQQHYPKAIHAHPTPVHEVQVYHAPVQSYPSHPQPAPAYHAASAYKKPVVPAPLNHDGTVADTPEIKAAKAIHFAAHGEAFARIASVKKHQYPVY